ncbi:hypothetical protein [Candidatus Nitrospira bockiana]
MSKHIAVIADQPLAGRLRELFEGVGYLVTERRAPPWVVADEPRLDGIVLEVRPGEDGQLEQLGDFITSEPAIPVIVVTSEHGTALRAVGAGARGYVLAPVDPPHIIELARQWFGEP